MFIEPAGDVAYLLRETVFSGPLYNQESQHILKDRFMIQYAI